MEARAIAKHVHVSPRKLKPINDMVRGMNVAEALAVLDFTPRTGAKALAKVIKSAKANAENNHEMDADKLYLAEVYANQAPTMKRWRAASMGRGVRILKRTSHIGVVVKERV
ncbi:50S ribosomal protein L22 [Lutibacter sp. B2]|nr:50S ribosomal protein L22 [Lutibacter sp. B2]